MYYSYGTAKNLQSIMQWIFMFTYFISSFMYYIYIYIYIPYIYIYTYLHPVWDLNSPVLYIFYVMLDIHFMYFMYIFTFFVFEGRTKNGPHGERFQYLPARLLNYRTRESNYYLWCGWYSVSTFCVLHFQISL